jgi:hypothetical protein
MEPQVGDVDVGVEVEVGVGKGVGVGVAFGFPWPAAKVSGTVRPTRVAVNSIDRNTVARRSEQADLRAGEPLARVSPRLFRSATRDVRRDGNVKKDVWNMLIFRTRFD